MEPKTKLVTLNQMTQESLQERPLDSIQAIGEYLKNIHETIHGDIEYLKIPQKEIQRVLSYNLKLEDIDLELDNEQFHIIFNSMNPTEQEKLIQSLGDEEATEKVLSALLDVQLQAVVLSEDTEEIEQLFNKTLVALDKKSLVLAKKIAPSSIKQQFRVAITQTSLMVFIAAYKATKPDDVVNFDKFIREFLAYSKDDDKDIYKMRQFYLNEINADYLGIGYIPEQETSPEEAETIAKEVLRSRKEYDSLLSSLKEKYLESKLHLV